MKPSPTMSMVKHVYLDVHGETISVGVAEAAGEVRSYVNIPSHTHAFDRFHKKLSEGGSNTVRKPPEHFPGTAGVVGQFRITMNHVASPFR